MLILKINKAILVAIVCCFTSLHAAAQYYLAGNTTDSGGNSLPFVKIRLHASGALYESGSEGGFGIPSSIKKDSATCTLHGYDTLKTVLAAGTVNLLRLKKSPIYQDPPETKTLSSLTKNMSGEEGFHVQAWGESYSEVVENGVVKTKDFPVTGFCPNGNNASYSNIRRFINNGVNVPPDAVRLEELLNYFQLSTSTTPRPGDLFNFDFKATDCPWNKSNKLLFLNAQAKTLTLDKVPAANLVFLIDNSGSMDMPNRLPLLKSAFTMLARNLRDTDQVSIVTYGGTAGIILPPTSGREKEKIINVIRGLMPGGSTPGSNGIQMAYELAINTKIVNGNNRVILATDGDFNVGITEEPELIKLIETYRNSGIFLTCLGVGMGNYKDSKIEVLAKHGNGNFAYLDKETEAEKVMVKELTQNLYAVASDVTMHVEFDPRYIKTYRLVGYDNRREILKDTSSKLLGSEIGSGYSMVSVFEIEPQDSSEKGIQVMKEKTIARLRVEAIDTKTAKKANIPVINVPFAYQPFDSADPRMRFAATICMFGGMLRESSFFKGIDFDQVATLAAGSANRTDPLQTEFLSLVDAAKAIYQPEKRKKRPLKNKDE